MKVHSPTRHGRTMAIGVIACAITVLGPTASAIADALYCGAGRGPTSAVAVQSAIWDAENSAQGDGLFTCTLVGEPQVFFIENDPIRGHFFRASVKMSCS
jgi:hypothetical protein